MKKRRIVTSTIKGILIFCLCTTGSTKSIHAFDISNSTGGGLLNKRKILLKDQGNNQVFSVPPFPRNKRGALMCTKNRYIQDEKQIGVASWYGGAFDGRFTASGERFDKNAFTIAHLTLPMGTEILVENPENGTIFYARVTDCGPYVKNRIADLSYGLAKKLGMIERGKGTVIITVL